MSYTALKRDYQYRTAMGGWRFILAHHRFACCPYWNAHREFKNRLLGDLLFEKWQKRPATAYKLYWRMHPEEAKIGKSR